MRILSYTIALVILLLAALVGWLLADIRANLDHDEAGPSPARIESYAEPPPSAVGPRQALGQAAFDPRKLAEPPVAARPWTRWWWPGGDVAPQSACRQLEALRDRGFGGVEIQPFSAGLAAIDDAATQTRVNSFDSPRWYDALGEVMDCAERLGVVVYLNHLSGWPAGGPQVALRDGLWTLRYAEERIQGGSQLRLQVPVPAPGVNDYLMALAEQFIGMELVTFAVDERELVAVLAARVVGGSRSGNPLDATDTLELDPESVTVLTDSVVNGELTWQAPAGDWVVVAAYLMPSGEPPTLVAAERPGFIIDHLHEAKLRAHYDYAYGTRTGLTQHYGRAFRGFFNDSLEFKLDRLAATDIMEAFATRRGYDLTPYLPAVFVDARDNFFIRDVGRTRSAPTYRLDTDDERIRYDYQLTLSDLIIERFAEGSSKWAAERGLSSRGQTYGFEMDTIRALGANDIPETEHLWGSSSEYVMKLASAAGLLYGRPLISAESFVWYKRAYAVTPRHIKAGADLLFLAGVNQVIYHGVPYVSDAEPYTETFDWLGWYPFQGPDNPSGFAANYGPVSPVWDALPQLNDYIARSQHILQSGQPDVDVLVYYPFLGFPKTIEDSPVAAESFLFKGLLPGDPQPESEGGDSLPFATFLPGEHGPRRAWLEQLIPTLRALDARGITWSWVNGHALESGLVNSNVTQAVVVADVESMPLDAVMALEALTDSAVQVLYMGDLPRRQPGYKDSALRDKEVASRTAALAAGRQVTGAPGIAAAVRPALGVSGSPAVRRVSRKYADGSGAHLFVNQSTETATAVLDVGEAAESKEPYWFDADSGAVWPAVRADDGSFSLVLGPLEARFLLLGAGAALSASPPLAVEAAGAAGSRSLESDWTLTVAGQKQPVGEPTLQRKLPYADGARVELVYETTFQVDRPDLVGRTVLDLGEVSGVARVTVNGSDPVTRAYDPFLFDISSLLRVGENTLSVRIEPPLRNSLVSAKGLMDEELAQFGGQVGAVGLAGPVTLLRMPTARQQ